MQKILWQNPEVPTGLLHILHNLVLHNTLLHMAFTHYNPWFFGMKGQWCSKELINMYNDTWNSK